MKPTSKYERQRTFVEVLQSRIDVRANEIAYEELFQDKATLKYLRYHQHFDKRLLGYIIDLHRHQKFYRTVAMKKFEEDAAALYKDLIEENS